MNIRELRIQDLEDIQKIHEKYYESEFSLPDFFGNFLCGFVVEENGEIITAGGVKRIAELIFVTDKSKTHRQRRTALYKGLEISSYLAGRNGFDQLHAFIQDEKWLEVMESRGFSRCKGIPLYIGVE